MNLELPDNGPGRVYTILRMLQFTREPPPVIEKYFHDKCTHPQQYVQPKQGIFYR
jgi:hypothetical protein